MDVRISFKFCALILFFNLCFAQFQPPQNNANQNPPFVTNGQNFLGNNPGTGQQNFPGTNNNFNGQPNPVSGQQFGNNVNGQQFGNNIPGQGNQIPPINPNTLGVNTGVNNQMGGFPLGNNNAPPFPGNNNPPGVGIAGFQPGFQTVNNQFQNPFVVGNGQGGFGQMGPGFGPGNVGGPGGPGGPPGSAGGQLLMSLSQNFNNYRYATCYFNVTSGSSILGRADFRQFIFGDWPVEIRVQVVGLPTSPVDTQRGIHIHEYGDTGGNCARVGPHFNPTLTRHGGRNNYPAFMRHVGDLGNMLQSPKGVASTQFRDNIISLQGQNNIIGRSLVIKYERDDEGTGTNTRSQVDGNARTPVACCTIGRAGPGNWQDPYSEQELVVMSGGVWTNSNFGGNDAQLKNTFPMDTTADKTKFTAQNVNSGGNSFNGGSQNIGALDVESFNGGGSPVGGNTFNGNMGGAIQGNTNGQPNQPGGFNQNNNLNTNNNMNTNNNLNTNTNNNQFTFGTQGNTGTNTNTNVNPSFNFNTNTNTNNNNNNANPAFTFGTQGTGTNTNSNSNSFDFLGGKKRRKRSIKK